MKWDHQVPATTSITTVDGNIANFDKFKQKTGINTKKYCSSWENKAS